MRAQHIIPLASCLVMLTLAAPAAFADGDAHKAKQHTTKHAKKDAHAPAGPEQTLSGEIVDIVCYLQHPESARGDDHAACARQCINKGLPAALLSNGKLYLLMKPGHAPIVEDVAPLAGKQVKVTGVVIERDGMNALVIKSLAPSKG